MTYFLFFIHSYGRYSSSHDRRHEYGAAVRRLHKVPEENTYFLSPSASCVCVSAGVCNKLKWLLAWPLCLLLYFTVPNCSKPRWENWFLLSFAASTLWIASFSYIMVWMVRDRPGFSLRPELMLKMGCKFILLVCNLVKCYKEARKAACAS